MKRVLTVAFTLLIASVISVQAAIDYAALHNMLIKFYGYQRAGLKTGSACNPNSGFTDASHSGDNYNGTALDGGWYDAGDYIKFGMNLAYAVYCLQKGYDVFPSAYDNKTDWTYKGTDQIPDILNEIKYATDYMCKAVISENLIILDVGKAQEEHMTWGVTNAAGRDASKCVTCSGADIPATYAACLALMSTLYKKYDSTYAKQCLDKAKIAFAFAKKKIDQGGDNNLYCTPQLKNGAALYDYSKNATSGAYDRQIEDRMVAAGVELYRATNDGDPIYRTWAGKTIGANYNCMGYTFVGPLASFEAWRQGLGTNAALSSNVAFCNNNIKTADFFKGVYQNSGWGTARDMGTVAFEFALAYVASGDENLRKTYLDRVNAHVNWVTGNAGSTPRSYIIGFNSSPANYIHYRSSRSGPLGGIVSGPNGSGSWANDGSAEFCEVAIDYNAGLVGAVAFLKALANPGDAIQVPTAFSATPKSDVNFNTGTVKFAGAFSKSVPWTITITGAFGNKKIAKTGTTISETWDGSADEGFFLSGETVNARLDVDGTIIAYDILKTKAVSISIASAKKAAAKSADVLVDDFEDSDSTNKKGGTWIPIGNATTGLYVTKIAPVTQDGSVAMQVSGNVTSSSPTTYAGVKTTFNADGSAISFGAAQSIIFDLKSTKATNVYVELEQSDITDGAYFSAKIPVTTSSNRYRLNFSEFKQPEWKTSAKTFSLNNIKSVRFTMYDSTGSTKLYLDNVAIESLNTGVIPGAKVRVSGLGMLSPVMSNSKLLYQIPEGMKSSLGVAIYNMSGRIVLRQNVVKTSGNLGSVSLSGLPAGAYTVQHYADGKILGAKAKFVLY